jgi:hypothetical protein
VVFHNQVRYCSGLAHLGDGCFLGLQIWKAIGNFLLPLRKERENLETALLNGIAYTQGWKVKAGHRLLLLVELARVLRKLPFPLLAWDQLAGSCSNLKSFGNAPFLKKRGEGTAFAFRDSGSADGNHPDQKRGIPKKGIPASPYLGLISSLK